MILSAKKGIQQIVRTLNKLGLKEIILCPGSRDAPLMISFNRHPGFQCTSIRDERSAAFFAMGKALELQEPIALVCTSGSAALNFAPAIAEAYYQRIPLLVLTADRPKEWTDQGDGQTINQTEVYKNYIRKSYELNGDAKTAKEFWQNKRFLCEGYHTAYSLDKGPVHFNIPLSEPLYETEETEEIPVNIMKFDIPEKRIPKDSLKNLQKLWVHKKKVMILVGQYPKDSALQNELTKISEKENVIVLTESTANVHHPDFIENIDRCITHLNEKKVREFQPELLITIGGAIVSKRIKKMLREYPPKEHWNIHLYDAAMDTYQSLTRSIPLDPVTFLKQIGENIEKTSSVYKENWLKWSRGKADLQARFCKNIPFSDFYFYNELYKVIPENIHLHVSNSSPIRYIQLFNNQGIINSWSNRGTSGIDGCTSTAVGAASASPEKKFLLITGDVAFHYDINALWNEEKIDNLNIIVLNNGGGGIFRIIPGPDRVEELKPYFETGMKGNAKEIAKHYGWNYESVTDEYTLEKSLNTLFKKDTKRTILEVFTNREENPKVLQQYWQYLNKNNDG